MDNVIIVNCDYETVASIEIEISRLSGCSSQKSARRNLDATVAGAIVAITITTIKTVPQVLDILRKWSAQRQIDRIVWKDIEINKPTSAQFNQLIQLVSNHEPVSDQKPKSK